MKSIRQSEELTDEEMKNQAARSKRNNMNGEKEDEKV